MSGQTIHELLEKFYQGSRQYSQLSRVHDKPWYTDLQRVGYPAAEYIYQNRDQPFVRFNNHLSWLLSDITGARIPVDDHGNEEKIKAFWTEKLSEPRA